MKRPDCAKPRGYQAGAATRAFLASDGRRWVVAALAIAASAGCGDGPEDNLPRRAVYGTVSLDGKPLDQGVISFTPEAQGTNPVTGGGVISSGSFSIPQDRGLTPGTYKVAISADTSVPPVAAGQAPGATPKVKAKVTSPIPAKYNTQSTLEAEVKDGSTSLKFDLFSK